MFLFPWPDWPIIHGLLHVLVPALAARVGRRKRWLRAWGVMVLANLVDLDHLLADPIFDPQRCSIGFHPLHSYLAVAVYAVLPFFRKTRVLGVGLLIHMGLDGIDCL